MENTSPFHAASIPLDYFPENIFLITLEGFAEAIFKSFTNNFLTSSETEVKRSVSRFVER